MPSTPTTPSTSSLDQSPGALLRWWRKRRRMSQLELAHESEVSTRHISFVENGRAQPSKEMVLLLCSALEVPLRERNRILLAAGFAPAYRATALASPEMSAVRRTLELILRQAEPFGAVVINRCGDLQMSNVAATRSTALLCHDSTTMLGLGPPNILRLVLHPSGLRKSISNWEEVALALLARALREQEQDPDAPNAALLREVETYPDVADLMRLAERAEEAPQILVPIHFRRDSFEASVVSTLTSLGTAVDLTLKELRIETFYPADEASERALRGLAEMAP